MRLPEEIDRCPVCGHEEDAKSYQAQPCPECLVEWLKEQGAPFMIRHEIGKGPND